MGLAIPLRSQAEKKRDQNKSDDAFFLRCENETLLQLVEFPASKKFQCGGSFFTRGRTRTER